jgi:hypothetical protein
MAREQIHTVVSYVISLVWIANGLFCKVLNLVPRHEQIVSRILGKDHSRLLTILIGLSEIAMAFWILSRVKKRFCAITQTIVVATMNTLEFILVPDLLLWGKLNSLFAFFFILLIVYNEFLLSRQRITQV